MVLLLINYSLKSMDLEHTKSLAKATLIGAIVSLSFGVINWLLMAPVWGALLHLALADILWVLFVYLIGQMALSKTLERYSQD